MTLSVFKTTCVFVVLADDVLPHWDCAASSWIVFGRGRSGLNAVLIRILVLVRGGVFLHVLSVHRQSLEPFCVWVALSKASWLNDGMWAGRLFEL